MKKVRNVPLLLQQYINFEEKLAVINSPTFWKKFTPAAAAVQNKLIILGETWLMRVLRPSHLVLKLLYMYSNVVK